MPAYDIRMYPSVTQDSERGVTPLSESERMLFILARQCAFQLGDWFFANYDLLSPEGTRYLNGREEFWALSLLHHANYLLRYKLMAEKKKPRFSTQCSAAQLQQQLQHCLRPFEAEISSISRVIQSHVAGPGDCSLVVFFDEASLGQVNDDPLHALPLTLYTSYLYFPAPLPSVEKRNSDSDL